MAARLGQANTVCIWNAKPDF